MPVAQKLECFEREAREGREAAEHADQHKCARLRPQQKPLLREADNHAKRDASDDVDGKGPGGKKRRRETVDERRKQISRDRSERAADADEQQSHV